MPKKIFLFVLFLTFLRFISPSDVYISITEKKDDYDSFVYAGCSQPKYTPGSPYQFNVESLLTSLVNAAAFSAYANFTSSTASSAAPAYGVFQCRADLPVSTCGSCIRSALSILRRSSIRNPGRKSCEASRITHHHHLPPSSSVVAISTRKTKYQTKTKQRNQKEEYKT